MNDIDLRQKIMNHLDGLNELERQVGMQKMLDIIAERYDAPVEVVQKTIAEWEAGHIKTQKKSKKEQD